MKSFFYYACLGLLVTGTACSSSGPGDGKGPDGKDIGSNTPAGGDGSGKGGDKKENGNGNGGNNGSSLPESCEELYGTDGCCDELAEQSGQATNCDAARKAIVDGLANGGSAATYESGCKQSLTAAQSAGYCK